MEAIHLHPRKWPALIPLIAGLIIFIFFSPQQHNYTTIVVSGFLVLVSIIMFILISKVTVVIDDKGIRHKNLFLTKDISWDSFSRTYLKYRSHGQSGSYYWYFETPDAHKKRFSIRLFSRTSLQSIAAAVTAKRKEAISDERIERMAEGKFPWYIF